MICHSCKYERTPDYQTRTIPIYYKSGAKKGQVKATRTETVDEGMGDEDFESVTLLLSVAPAQHYCGSSPQTTIQFTELHVNICPKCGTIFKDL